MDEKYKLNLDKSIHKNSKEYLFRIKGLLKIKLRIK